jgi:type I restriction enzyme S subunit
MKKVKLGDISKVQSGQSAPKNNQFSEEGIPFIRAGHLNDLLNGIKVSDLPRVDNETAKSKNYKLLPKGTILFAKSGMSATKNRVYQLDEEAYYVSHLASIKVDKSCDSTYIKYFLKNFKPSRLISDPAYPSIKLSDINNIEVPLPPLSEQKHIAEVLDKADALRQKNKELLEEYNELQKAIFIDLFGDPVSNSMGWEKKKLGELIKSIDSGWSPKCESQPVIDNSEWGVLTLSSVTKRVYQARFNKKLPEGLVPKEEIVVHKGDLLFSRKNTKELVGASAYVFDTPDKLMMSDTIFRINCRPQDLNPLYLNFLINDANFRYNIQRQATGSAGSMPNISKEKLKNLNIFSPPLDLQNKFAKMIENIEQQKDKVKESLAYSEELFGALEASFFNHNN